MLLITKEATFVFVCLKSWYPSDSNAWENHPKSLLRYILIISKGKNIGVMMMNGGVYVLLITQDNLSLRKSLLDNISPINFMMERRFSFFLLDTMISCDHDDHLPCESLRFCEVKFMSRMENIKCTETHHKVKLLIWEVRMREFVSLFPLLMRKHGKCHKREISQIQDRLALWTL